MDKIKDQKCEPINEYKTKKMFKIKRIVSLIFIILAFIGYYIGTDPDTKVMQNLPFGISLILTFNIFIIGVVGIAIVEFIPDFIVDKIYGKEENLTDIAKHTANGAGYALIAKSIRILAYSIIFAASIVAYNIGA